MDLSMLKSLRGKLIFSHLAVIFLAIALVTFLLLTLGKGYFLTALEQSLVAQAHFIANALIPGATVANLSETTLPAYNALQQQSIGNLEVQVENKEPSSIPDLAPNLKNSNLAYLNVISVELNTILETRLLVMDNQGIVLIDSSNRDVGRDLKDNSAILEALSGRQKSRTEDVSGEEWLFVAVPVWIEEGIAGVIYLGQPLRDVTAVLADLRFQLLLVLAISLPFSALIGLILARNISHPVRTLTIAAKKLQDGNFEYPLETSSQDELGELSRTFADMRDQLQSVERMRTQFVSDVSHELRTPLTAIKGLSETLRDGAADDSSVRDRFLASVEDETDRLIRLVNDLLVLSRADAQALKLHIEKMDLEALIEAALERMNPRAESLDLALCHNYPEAPLHIHGDPDRIEQVLLILLDNALKHSPHGADVWVEISRVLIEEGTEQIESDHGVPALPPGEWVIIGVTDAGTGISPEDLPFVFDRFYRADHSRSRDRGGSGLGLSIARALIEAQGGHIWLESPSSSARVREGQIGTTACFALPAA
jgi:signal transduction histidine kinase